MQKWFYRGKEYIKQNVWTALELAWIILTIRRGADKPVSLVPFDNYWLKIEWTVGSPSFRPRTSATVQHTAAGLAKGQNFIQMTLMSFSPIALHGLVVNTGTSDWLML